MLMTIYECDFLCIHIVNYIFIIEIVCVLLVQKQLVYRVFFRVRCEHTWFMDFNSKEWTLHTMYDIQQFALFKLMHLAILLSYNHILTTSYALNLCFVLSMLS